MTPSCRLFLLYVTSFCEAHQDSARLQATKKETPRQIFAPLALCIASKISVWLIVTETALNPRARLTRAYGASRELATAQIDLARPQGERTHKGRPWLTPIAARLEIRQILQIRPASSRPSQLFA
ncbi:hypothetical protein BB8028_0004g13340 [Beauveria bassiana]|uniref:Secreted protein n=1 Tax=Beauveria bassiana TaxID=176275 RepID=A0A2S7YEH1_BEABA|nr:hypothetical protein BB8028_0004g13340 [Beauveria bassiana]